MEVIVSTRLQKKLGHAIVCQFSDYVKQKDEWISQHPDAIIIEEIKSLSIAQINIPPGIVGVPKIFTSAQNQQVLMITWAIVYEE